MGVLTNMSQHRGLIDLVKQHVGHIVHFDSTDGDVLGNNRVETLWRVVPAEDMNARDFFYWYRSCNRQWFLTAEEAASAYCSKWKEWHHANAKKADQSIDTIEYRP